MVGEIWLVDFLLNSHVIPSRNACMQSTKYFKVQQISSVCLRDVEQITIMRMCWAQAVSLCFLASAPPPGISWASEILLMNALRDTVALHYDIWVGINCNQKQVNFFISNMHKCRLMRPDGYMSWFVSSKQKEWEVFQNLESESTAWLHVITEMRV